MAEIVHLDLDATAVVCLDVFELPGSLYYIIHVL
jgi:hypothetical protein